MPGTNLKLNGQFKFDLYTPQGELITGSKFIDNFITNSGVLYPYHFAFADCFRYLSVGVGTLANSIVTSGSYLPTTGLSSPLSQYSYIGSRQAWDGGQNSTYYATPGSFGAGCGYINNDNGVSLVRQWNLPDNTGGVFNSAQIFNEFMVSPGQPYVTGVGGVKLCTCAETDGVATTGKDCSSIAEYYDWLASTYTSQNHSVRLRMCDAKNAFARVLPAGGVSVVSGSVLTVTYQLNIVVDTGIHYTSLAYNRGDNNTNWNYQLNSFNTITNPGVALINDGTVFGITAPNGNQRLQHFDYNISDGRTYTFANEYGESIIGPFGAPLEPSNFFQLNQPANQNVVVYFSNDDLQFIVSPNGGAFTATGNYSPWNIWADGNISGTYSYGQIVSSGGNSYQYINVNPSSGNFLTNTAYWSNIGAENDVTLSTSGLMGFSNNNETAIISGGGYWSASPNAFNIRTSSGFAPNPGDITQNSGMTASSFTSVKASQPTFSLSFIGNNAANGTRSGQVSYTYSFENYTFSNGLQVKSFVAAYQDVAYGTAFGMGDNVNSVPFFDSVFSGVSGAGTFLPGLESVTTGVWITGIDNLDYNNLQSQSNSLYPILNLTLGWNVPCPSNVVGCS